jgi:hypothetical protein
MCLKAYEYTYINKPKEVLPIFDYMALGIFLHRRIEKFFKPDGTPRNKTAQAFANSARATWQRCYINPGEINGVPIRWRSGASPYIMKNEIGEMCTNIYARYAKEGPPLETELKLPIVNLEGKFIAGTIDELRRGQNGPIIRDHKSGRSQYRSLALEHDVQFTVYALIASTMAHFDEDFRERTGMQVREARRLGGNPNLISPRVQIQIHKLRTGEIIPTWRRDSHYTEVAEMLEHYETMIREGRFPRSRGTQCAYCKFQEVCSKDSLRSRLDLRSTPRLYPSKYLRGKGKQLRLRLPRRK